jgi:hypothetical protein
VHPFQGTFETQGTGIERRDEGGAAPVTKQSCGIKHLFILSKNRAFLYRDFGEETAAPSAQNLHPADSRSYNENPDEDLDGGNSKKPGKTWAVQWAG